MGARCPHRRRRAGSRRGAVPQRRLLGAAVSGRRAAGPAGGSRRRRADRGGVEPTLRAPSAESSHALDGSDIGRRAKRGRRPRRHGSGVRHPARAVGDRPERGRRRRARTRAAVLDAARHARPRPRADHRPCQPAQAVRAAAVGVPGCPVPAHRRRSGTQRAGDPRQVRAVERRLRPSRKPSTTLSRCGCRPSRRQRWSSGCAISCTARSDSATRPRCRGCPATASRCGGYRSGCPPPATS